jgi:hypothetical protein
MSGDSIDSAVNRSKNRAVYVGAGVQYLGKDRQREAELLADFMVAQVDLISASAAVEFAPNAEVSDAVLRDLVRQTQAYGEEIAHVAIRAMTAMFLKLLIVATRQ